MEDLDDPFAPGPVRRAARALRSSVRRRAARFRARLRPGPEPASVWMRAQWKSLLALAIVCGSVLALDAWLATCGLKGCPTPAEIRAFRPAEGGRILDRNGEMVGRLANIRRVNVPLAEIPQSVRQAFIATEDRRFYEHGGFDGRAAVRAAWRNVSAMRVREGFSTITMQVTRNAFVARSFSQRTLRRKLIELRLARLLEQHLEKDQILELYLNVIYLGAGTYGVEAASRDLFGKSVREVSLDEAAVLAALPKGPSSLTPRRHAERARARRDVVLGLMAREGYIPTDSVAAAGARPMRISETEWRPDRTDDTHAIDAVRAVVDSVLSRLGIDVGDVTVHTTLDNNAQRAADRAVRRRAAAITRETQAWYGKVEGSVEGAMVVLDARTGDIRALVGGSTYKAGGFNRALAARRQPGSAFKPFVYAAALSAGLTPATMVDDEPIEITEGQRVWTPANYGGEYLGRVTLRRALMRSSNAAAVRVSRAVGEGRVITAARQSGISSPLQPVPSIALGSLEVTPLELVAAYAPFANGGMRVRPRLVRRIEAADGTLLWSSEVERSYVMDPRDAFQMTSMLRAAVDHGTGRAVRDGGVTVPVAGKTGTTNNGADVWFVGYTPTMVAGVWFGFDRPRPISGNAAGGRLAAPAWAEFYRAGWREREDEAGWTPPDGLVPRNIDAHTGELAGEWCPVTQREWFKIGTEPLERCREHEYPTIFSEIEIYRESIGDRVGRALRRIIRF